MESKLESKMDLSELIRHLYLSGSLIAGKKIIRHDGREAYFDLRLRDPVCKDPDIRSEIAIRFAMALDRRYQREGEVRKYGLIGISWALAPIVGMLGAWAHCPLAYIAPQGGVVHSQRRIYGAPAVGYRYALIDDTIMTGRTIASALEEWSAIHEFPVDTIIAFCDRQEGGVQFIRKELRRLIKESGTRLDIEIISITTRRKMLAILKDQIPSDAYRMGLNGIVTSDMPR